MRFWVFVFLSFLYTSDVFAASYSRGTVFYAGYDTGYRVCHGSGPTSRGCRSTRGTFARYEKVVLAQAFSSGDHFAFFKRDNGEYVSVYGRLMNEKSYGMKTYSPLKPQTPSVPYTGVITLKQQGYIFEEEMTGIGFDPAKNRYAKSFVRKKDHRRKVPLSTDLRVTAKSADGQWLWVAHAPYYGWLKIEESKVYFRNDPDYYARARRAAKKAAADRAARAKAQKAAAEEKRLAALRPVKCAANDTEYYGAPHWKRDYYDIRRPKRILRVYPHPEYTKWGCQPLLIDRDDLVNVVGRTYSGDYILLQVKRTKWLNYYMRMEDYNERGDFHHHLQIAKKHKNGLQLFQNLAGNPQHTSVMYRRPASLILYERLNDATGRKVSPTEGLPVFAHDEHSGRRMVRYDKAFYWVDDSALFGSKAEYDAHQEAIKNGPAIHAKAKIWTIPVMFAIAFVYWILPGIQFLRRLVHIAFTTPRFLRVSYPTLLLSIACMAYGLLQIYSDEYAPDPFVFPMWWLIGGAVFWMWIPTFAVTVSSMNEAVRR